MEKKLATKTAPSRLWRMQDTGLRDDLKQPLGELYAHFGPRWFRKKEAVEIGVPKQVVTALVAWNHLATGYQGFRVMRTVDGTEIAEPPTL